MALSKCIAKELGLGGVYLKERPPGARKQVSESWLCHLILIIV